jgi:alpha-D-xyloside xylohydrolase
MGIPIDAVVQDWQYWLPGQWGSHQFDPKRYPDPKAMVAAIHAMHVHTIISVWPRFDLKTANLAELSQAGAVLPGVFKNVYPAGFGRWYDAWNARGRQIYWSQIMKSLGVLGFDGWWLDGDEAELGGVPGEIREESTAAGPGIAVNNSFPLVHTTAVHDGMRRDQPDKRVFLLSRSAYAGQQRNGAITWSGDTHASWETLAKQIPAALNFSMSGIPYWSADIGGFFSPDPRKDKAYVELFVRWHQFGVFTPMFRIHGSGQGKEIWNFDKPTQRILIDDVTLRYRLLPYLYSMAWDVSHDHGTMMRALAFDFADDARAVKATDEYLFGKAFLVAPVLHPGIASRSVYLPAGSHWFDFRTGAEYAGGQRVDVPTTLASIPVLVRDGSIVPLGPVKPYADAPSNAPMELRLYPGRDGDYALYNDSGDGYGYQHGAYTVIPIHWDDQRHVLEIAARKGRYPGMRESLRFRVTCGAAAGRGVSIDVTYSGKAKRLSVPACHI